MLVDRLRQFLAVDLIHEKARQRVAVELDMPTLSGPAGTYTSGAIIAFAICRTSKPAPDRVCGLLSFVRCRGGNVM